MVDADTLLVTANGTQSTVQLAYIVAPEPQQKFGTEAKQYIESLALNQALRIYTISSFENVLTAEVYSSKKQDPINRELVRKGLAWPILENDTKHPYDLSVSYAQKHLLGVWSDPELKPPGQLTSSDGKQTALSPYKVGAEREASQSQSPSSGAHGGNFLMRKRDNINRANTTREAQEAIE
ncbi:MAG: thermonuclease family protein [Deltaproteobacteria bacterium]|nr:thermonuclease family protein [Deltaproteobacteria bacterium]